MNDHATEQPLDAVIVGAGLAGLYMLHRLRQSGLDARVFEAGSGVGGTWFWNRYPGARCDVESMEYSYQFSDELQQEWEWSERYAGQPEILRYIEHVADRFALRDGITLDTRVRSARFDEASDLWWVETDAERIAARYVVLATGCLSSTNLPDFPGRDDFRGATYHTGRWPHEPVDFTGLRVGVIGTGSSAIQSIPLIAKQAQQLTVFQRTPNYSIPAHNAPLSQEQQRAVKERYPQMRAEAKTLPFGLHTAPNDVTALETSPEERRRLFDERWQRGGLAFLGVFTDLLESQEANDTAAEFIREKIHGVVDDPEIAETLSPQTVVGCKRLCIDTDYYATYNRDNVELVDLRKEPLETLTPGGLRAGGKDY
jgi:cyclohexanone monooxygenase